MISVDLPAPSPGRARLAAGLLAFAALAVASASPRPAPAREVEIRDLPLGRGDRLLVLAPHPDDEVLGAAGVILGARALGAPVHVAFLTSGEANRWSGLADGGTLTLWREGWGAARPYRSPFSGASAVPLPGAYRPGAGPPPW